jgi:short-subunit dehydrogenase
MTMPEKVMITGASSGIGEALAHVFAKEKAELHLTARRSERLASVSEDCLRRGAARVVWGTYDLSVPGQGSAAVEDCLSKLGGLDILICNAGYGVYGAVADVSPEQMARVWQVNYQSAYESVFTALPYFLNRNSGQIVLISSIVGKKTLPYTGTYSATKFAQVALGEALWAELRGTGVAVTVVCPGYTSTEFQQVAVRARGIGARRHSWIGHSAEKVASIAFRAIRKKRREVHLTLPGKLLLAIERLSPWLGSRIAAYAGSRERIPINTEEADGQRE